MCAKENLPVCTQYCAIQPQKREQEHRYAQNNKNKLKKNQHTNT